MESASTAGGFENSERSSGVDLVGGHWMSDRAWDRRPGGEVHNDICSRECPVKEIVVEDRTFKQGGVAAVEVVAKTEGQVVDYHSLVDFRERAEVSDQVGTDETGAAGDDDLHRDLFVI